MRLIIKAKKMSIGTISHGRKKVAEGKWVPVKSQKKLTVSVRNKISTDRAGIIASLPEEGTYKKSNRVISETPDGLKIYDYKVDGPLYRGVSMEDYKRIKSQGFIDTDMRGAISEYEGMNLATNRATAIEYIPSDTQGVVFAVDASNIKIWGIGADDYPRTNEHIPLNAVIGVSDVMDKVGESTNAEIRMASRRVAWTLENLSDAEKGGDTEEIKMWNTELNRALERYFPDNKAMQSRVLEEVENNKELLADARETINAVK